jgi:preprotein translocase subunit SecB
MLKLLSLKFVDLRFYNTSKSFDNVEIQVDVNHELFQADDDKPKETGSFQTATKFHIYPKDPNSIEGEFSITVELNARFSLEEKIDDESREKYYKETMQRVYPYVRTSVAGLTTMAQFPPLYLPIVL